MTIEIPETFMGKPIKGSIEIALAEQKRKTLEEKAQQERETPRAPEPPSQTPTPTPLPYKHIIPPNPDLYNKIIPPRDYSKLLKKVKLGKKTNEPDSTEISLEKLIEKIYEPREYKTNIPFYKNKVITYLCKANQS